MSRWHLCLVGTSNPENLGAVARLADNFGVAALTLVAPRVAADDARAQVVARTARPRLQAARTVATLDEAVRDCARVVGFSARRGDRPTVAMSGLAATLDAHAGPVALVFGPEDTGLHADDLARCDLVAVIETPGPLPSLNLAQAVAIALWGLSRPDPSPPVRGAATHAELEALIDRAFATLDRVGYFRDDAERSQARVDWRRGLAGAGLDSEALRALHGVLRAISRVQ